MEQKVYPGIILGIFAPKQTVVRCLKYLLSLVN